MKFIDINKRYTELVAEYIGEGYSINAASMGGSQGEISKVDLTDGKRILRVLVQAFNDWSKKLEGVEIIVGFSTDNVFPNSSNTFAQTIWNDRIEVIKTERFYELGVNRYNERFYGTEQEAYTAAKLRLKRYREKAYVNAPKNLSEKSMEIAKRVIRKKLGVSRIYEADVRITKRNGAYVVGYRNKTYRLH